MATARANLETVISADMSQFQATMRRAGMVAERTGGKIAREMKGAAVATLKAAAAAGAMAAALGAAALARGVKNAADMGGKLHELSARTGIAAGELAKLSRAFEDNGLSAEKIGPLINKLQKGIYEFGQGSETARKPFDELGLTFDEIGKLSPEKQFALIQKKISAIADPTKRAALAMQLFGKSGGELLTLFGDKDAFKNAGSALGAQIEILNRRAADFDEISDILGRTGTKLQGFFVGVLDAVSDDLLPILREMDAADWAKVGQDFGAALLVAAKAAGKILEAFDKISKAIVWAVTALRDIDFWKGAALAFSSMFIKSIANIGDFLTQRLIKSFKDVADAASKLPIVGKLFGGASEMLGKAHGAVPNANPIGKAANAVGGMGVNKLHRFMKMFDYISSIDTAKSLFSISKGGNGIANQSHTSGINALKNSNAGAGVGVSNMIAMGQKQANQHLSNIELKLGQALIVN